MVLLKSVFIPMLLNNPIASFSLINLNFLILHTAHFDQTIIPRFLGFYLVFLLYFKQCDNFVYEYIKNL